MAIQEDQAAPLHENDLFIFVHIPKTAGSTFKYTLARQFPDQGMPKIGPDYQASINHIRTLSAEEKTRVSCISGHVPYGIHRYFERRKPRYVSFVRDPVNRTLSEYFFLMKRPQLLPLIGLTPDAKLTPEAFLEQQVAMGMQDFQTRVLTGYDNLVESVLPPYRPMAITNVDELLCGIERSFDLIGTVERFDESLLLMRDRFGWRNTCYVSKHVGRPNSRRQELKQALGEQIRRLNPLDCRLHAHFSALIESKIQEQGEAFERKLRRFRLLNRSYSNAWQIYRGTGLRRLHNSLSRLLAGRA